MKSLKGYSTSGIILFALSMIYLGAELVFNRQLLDVSSNVQSDPDQVEHIQYFGRAASGLGFTLLVQGIFQQFGFRLVKRKHWRAFAAVALICLLPFLTVLAQSVYEKMAGAQATGDVPYTKGMWWGIVPFVGFFAAVTGRAYKPAVVLGLFLMTWPAMFYGQRLAVERFIISPTTAEERLNAHYILLLRSAIEDCTIVLDNTQFCDSKDAAIDDAVEKRSTRAVLGAMFMLNTNAVFDGINFSRKQLIDSIAERDMWFSSKGYYQQYLQAVADKRDQYEQYLNENYYLPYQQASDLYFKTYNKAEALFKQSSQSGQFEAIAADAAEQVANLIDMGWQQYQGAADNFNSKVASAVAAPDMGKGLYSRLCQGHENLCNNALIKIERRSPVNLNVNVDNMVDQAKKTAVDQFYARTGYPPDIASRTDFMNNEKTQDEIRAHVEEKLQEHIEGYELPYGWQYDPATFRSEVLQILQGEARGKALAIAAKAQQAWRDKVQSKFKAKIDPGLSREDFFKKLGGDPVPPLKALVMSEADFRKKYIVPINEEIANKTINAMKKEEPSFANRGEQAERGKEYIRVLYVPPIALCLSIMIVIITIGRYLTMAATDGAKKLRWVRGFSYRQLKLIRPFFWAVYVAVVLVGPYKWPNPYISTVAYQKYYTFARHNSPVITQVLDWVVHTQPIIYRAGAWMPEVGYMKG